MQTRPGQAPPDPDPADLGFGARPRVWTPQPQATPGAAEPSRPPEAPVEPVWPRRPAGPLPVQPAISASPLASPAIPRPLEQSRGRRPDRWVSLVAVVALIAGTFTAYQSWSISNRVSDLDERVRTATNELLDVRGRVIPLEHRSGAWLDATRVANDAAPAVFTIVSGRALGTGFGFYSDGEVTYIATNYHVVANAAERHQRVALYQGDRKWSGVTENWDRNSDVALVRVDEGLPVLVSAYGQGHDPVLGDPVLAFGSPQGLEGTATEGIISAIRQGWIQTDAQINPGNSGGPLLNSYGEVLGLTTLGIGGGGSGLGFVVNIREVCALAGDHTC